MKLIYVGEKPFDNRYKSLYKSLGIETISYKNPLKAIDNLVEIEPSVVFFSCNDYPRMWKIFLSSLRDIYNETQTLFILEGELGNKEIKEFNFLRGSLIVPKNNQNYKDVKKLILEKLPKSISTEVYFPKQDEIGLGFVKPEDFSFISGYITQINRDSFIFSPESIDEIANIKNDDLILNSSLSIDESIVNVDFKVKLLGSTLLCEIINDSTDYKSLTKTLFV